MAGHHSIAGAAIAGLDEENLLVAERLADRTRAGEQVALVTFVEIEAQPNEQPVSLAGDPIAGAAIAGIEDEAVYAQPRVTLLLSDREWAGSPYDPFMPNREALPVLISAGGARKTAPLLPTEARRTAATAAEIKALDASGELRAFLASHSILGLRVRFFVGEEGGDSADHLTYFTGVMGEHSIDEDEVSIDVEALDGVLDRPAQHIGWTGAGGEQGDPALAGQTQPAVFGPFFNAPGTLEEYAILSYRAHFARIDRYDRIKDKGAPLLFDGRHFETYADYRLAPSPPAGFYSTGPASRYRLGKKPAGVVTADGRGSVLFGAYQATKASFLLFLLRGALGGSDFQVDQGSFGALPTDDASLYLDGAEDYTIGDVANALLAEDLAWLDMSAQGRVSLGVLNEPDGGPPTDFFDDDDILPGWRLTPLGVKITHTQRVSYARNWRKMDVGEIVDPDANPDVDDDDFAALQRQEEWALWRDASLQLRVFGAKPGEDLRGYYTQKAPAERSARNIQTTFGRQRFLLEAEIPFGRAPLLTLGRRVQLTHERITMGKPKNMTWIEYAPDPMQGVTGVAAFI